MILKGLEEIKTFSGYKLWDVMRKAQRAGIRNVFLACFERAKELTNRSYGRWEEAKAHFDMQVFPDWEKSTRCETRQILGYPLEVHMEVDDTRNIKNQYMVLMNPKYSSAVIKWIIQNGEVVF